ncbi:MAG: ABC transporter permease [Candidatus Acidiferrales bacterium]
MSLRNSWIVYRKELRDMLRDKRTIRSMIIIPMIAFPLLFWGIGHIMNSVMGEAANETAPIMVQGGNDSPKVMGALSKVSGIRVLPYQNDAKQEVSDKTIRALVQIPDGFDAATTGSTPKEVSIGYYENDVKSEMARDKLQKFFDDYRDNVARAALAARGLPPGILEPFKVHADNIAPPAKVSAAVFGGWIPYLIIIFSFTGAMYPAMDLTAGEKERGTMETILSSPVSRTDLVLGKFLMVLTASVVTAVLSLASVLFAVRNMVSGAQQHSMNLSISASSILAVAVMLLPLTVLFASMLLAVALLAKSYREAQTYVSPLVFVAVAPAVIGALPGVELNWKTALVPILNTSLVSKEVIGGTYHWATMLMVFGMTSVYAAISLGAAIYMFNREDVLFRT